MWSAVMHGGELRVLDFGGSLGITYFHNQDLIQNLTVSWSVVEQEHSVTERTEPPKLPLASSALTNSGRIRGIMSSKQGRAA
jgi:hypothetical protein